MKNVLYHISGVVAFGGAAAGSVLIAMNVGMAALGYVAFLASSIASVYLLYKTKDAPKALILQSIFFIVVNILGLIRHSIA